MNKEKFAFFAAVHLILFKDGEVLLSRRFNTGWKDGHYSVVAGHIDGKETVAACMVREAQEEAGITIAESDLRIVHALHRITDYGAEYIDYFLTTETWTGEPTILEKDKCDDLRWFPVDQLPENMVPYVKICLEHIQNGVAFSEFKEA